MTRTAARDFRFNTQPPEGGWTRLHRRNVGLCSFNTQPPEGGWESENCNRCILVCFNTQPPEGGWSRIMTYYNSMLKFQHTAARRRLVQRIKLNIRKFQVSTHSRPKAAG